MRANFCVARAWERKLNTAARRSRESKCGSWLYHESHLHKEDQSDGEQSEREQKADDGNSMCFWLIWCSCLWIHHRCFIPLSLSFTSLLSLHPTTQNSFILFSPPPFSLSMSLPSLYSPSSSISAQPLPCLYAVKRADCVFEELVLSLKFLSHFPHFIFSLTVKFGCQTSPGGQPHNSHILYSAVTRSECIVEL